MRVPGFPLVVFEIEQVQTALMNLAAGRVVAPALASPVLKAPMLRHDRDRYDAPLSAELTVGLISTFTLGLACGWRAWVETPVYFVGGLVTSLAFVGAGTIVRRSAGKSRSGLALIFCGITTATRLVNGWDVGPCALAGISLEALFYLAAAWAVFSDPDDRSLPLKEKVVLGLIAAVPLNHLVICMFAEPEWLGYNNSVWWPTLKATSQSDLEFILRLVYLYESFLAVLFISAVWTKVRKTRGIDHSMSIPIAVGFCVAGVFGTMTAPGQAIPSPTLSENYFIFTLAFLSIPAGLLLAELRRRMKHIDIARSLHQEFAAAAPTVESVRNALRRSLDDATLEVFYWTSDQQAFVNTDGILVSIDAGSDRELRTVTTSTGEPLAVILAEQSLGRHSAILDTAVRASAIALENARLQAAMRSQLEEVRQSRARIAAAGMDERQRIERDLHDGVQQRLLALGIRLGLARQNSTDESVTAALDQCADELRSSLTLLRDLVHGIHPPELRQFGLSAAVDELAKRLPITVTVDVLEERLPDAVEATAYFVVCEALNNIVKHAAATEIAVEIRLIGRAMHVTIGDNGVGGDIVWAKGLTGLSDRVEAAHGRLTIQTSASGTTLTAIVECP